VNIPRKPDLELAVLLLNNTAQQGGSVGIGPEARASLQRVADYLAMLAITTPPRSDPPPS
jgi:hypothetical protein